MNISKIADMIRDDPTIPNLVAAFLTLVNAQNIRRVDKVTRTVEDVVVFVSIADMNGGLATSRDVQAAVNLLNQEPLRADAQARLERAQAAIAAGTITTVDQLKTNLAS